MSADFDALDAFVCSALSAFAIWLTVRIVCRRERWAITVGIVLAIVVALFSAARWIDSYYAAIM